ncbi:urease accessory protein UreE [Ferruginibacter paludis]|uniref:urease accessory protein UreE n=1 Tax=Ferruginibacter paludis TaxID=1310417 RepID=UPI0025B53361|nr:urease accessory protein UreE [Ferruginibacter paludis]MDN3658205.1 urease accessory protein UreE [Ferruginibacter paludis]
MLVKEKIGNLELFAINNRNIDYVLLDWYETNKRILHKKTVLGRELSMKFLNENPQLGVGDIVYEDDFGLIAVDINECDAIVIRPRSMHEVAAVCYEIGNKHLPLFYQDDEILVAFEAPLFQLLTSSGYAVEKAKRKLISPLKTTVAPHGSSNSLFNRIMKLTTDPE